MNHSNDLWKIHRQEKKYVEKYFARDDTAALALSCKANKHCLCSSCHFSWICITFRIATQGFLWGTEPFESLETSLPDSQHCGVLIVHVEHRNLQLLEMSIRKGYRVKGKPTKSSATNHQLNIFPGFKLEVFSY